MGEEGLGADLEELARLSLLLSGGYDIRVLGWGDGRLFLYAEGRWCSVLATVVAGGPAPRPEGGGWDYLLYAEGDGVSASAAFRLRFRERHPLLPLLLAALAGYLLGRVARHLSEPRLRRAALLAAEALSGGGVSPTAVR